MLDFSARRRVDLHVSDQMGARAVVRASPNVYLSVGLAWVLFSTSASGFAFSTLLIILAVTDLSLSCTHRSPEQQNYRKYFASAPVGRSLARKPGTRQ
jgi:hypothetical protein